MKKQIKYGFYGFIILIILGYQFQEKKQKKMDEKIQQEIEASHKQYLERYHERLFPEYEDLGPGKKYYDENCEYTHEDLAPENAIHDAIEAIHGQ